MGVFHKTWLLVRWAILLCHAINAAEIEALIANKDEYNYPKRDPENPHIATLCHVVKKNTTLKNLSIAKRKTMSTISIMAISEVILWNRTLQYLNLYKCGINPTQASIIALSLGENGSLTSISLSKNYLGVDGAESIANALKINTALESLYLDENEIYDEGCKYIAEAVSINTTLKKLTLKQNRIKTEGVTSLMTALTHNASLSDLDFCHNTVPEGALQSIAKTLASNATLTSICLEHTGHKRSLQPILEALRTNYTTINFKFDGCIIPFTDKELKNKYLARNLRIREHHFVLINAVLSMQNHDIPEDIITLILTAYYDLLF